MSADQEPFNPVAELIGQKLGVEPNCCHLTQAFEVGSLEPGRKVLGQGGRGRGGEVYRGGLESASAHPPPLPMLFLLSCFILLT